MESFQHIQNLFEEPHSPHEKYQKIIELGRSLAPFPEAEKTTENIVKGCQSVVYLNAEMKENKLFFRATSDALISAGLAALLIKAYDGQPPEFILKCKPTFIEILSINTSLSPGRSNGLASMYLQMQKHALKFLTPVA